MGLLLPLLARPAALRALDSARKLLATPTPLVSDCGKRCNHACCQSDETGENGMLLFPFEEHFYRKPIPGFPFRLLPDDSVLKGGRRLVCEGHCPREHRPLSCRLFPLRLRITFDGPDDRPHANAEIDPRSWAICPLPERGGLPAFAPSFVEAVEQAGALLVHNLWLLEFLVVEQEKLDESRRL